MATLFLICGLPGAGKTTLAKQIEQSQTALRLCPDEWIASLLQDDRSQEKLDRLRAPVEAIQWEMAKRALFLGVDVILEFGFWSRAERDRFRAGAAEVGANVVLHYLDVSHDELWARLQQRNANLPPGTFAVTKEQLDFWWGWFEPPTADELSEN